MVRHALAGGFQPLRESDHGKTGSRVRAFLKSFRDGDMSFHPALFSRAEFHDKHSSQGTVTNFR
jgi:hypothetical protein